MLPKGVFAPPEKLNFSNYEEVLAGGFLRALLGKLLKKLCFNATLMERNGKGEG